MPTVPTVARVELIEHEDVVDEDLEIAAATEPALPLTDAMVVVASWAYLPFVRRKG